MGSPGARGSVRSGLSVAEVSATLANDVAKLVAVQFENVRLVRREEAWRRIWFETC